MCPSEAKTAERCSSVRHLVTETCEVVIGYARTDFEYPDLATLQLPSKFNACATFRLDAKAFALLEGVDIIENAIVTSMVILRIGTTTSLVSASWNEVKTPDLGDDKVVPQTRSISEWRGASDLSGPDLTPAIFVELYAFASFC